MNPLPPTSTRTDTLFHYPTLFRSDRHRRAQIDAGVEQFRRNRRRHARDCVKARMLPIAIAVNIPGEILRQVAHIAHKACGPRYRQSDAPIGRPAPIRRMVDITTLASQQAIEHALNIHEPPPSFSESWN